MENTWSREEISTCNCIERTYRHVHCPCSRCRGSATDRNTEIRHWRESNLLSTEAASVGDDTCESSAGSVTEETVEVDANFSEGSDENEDASSLDFNSDMGEPSGEQDLDMETQNPLKKVILTAVLDALKIMDDSGSSIKTFDDILSYGKTMLFTLIDESVDLDILSTMWPKSWNDVQLLLKEEGFEDAKEYFICFCRTEKEITRNNKTHKKFVYNGKYSIMESKEACCTHCGKNGYLKYYYLGLESKVKNWFKTETMCKKMLSHWKEKEHWLGRDKSWPLKNEFWDGQRWVDLQWFWDPSKVWPLPTLCVHCNAVISVEHLTTSPEGINNLKVVTCPECLETFNHSMEMARGSPLNLALIAHWDGWQPFGTSFRGCGSFEISIANMTKSDRCHVEEVYVVGFVPCSEIPKDLPEYLDPFLEPLMDDLSKGFISGFNVPYPLQFKSNEFHSSAVENIRLLLLCWAGDHPGQCEIGKFLNQGKCGCRREKLHGQHLENSSNNHYYYGNNRYHFRHPWAKRQIEQEFENLYDIENETRTSVRKKMSSDLGFTGMSLLHKYLYPLYQFDVTKHMVYDVFHTIPLNVVKNQLTRLLELEMVDTQYLDKQIRDFPWSRELKNGRLPKPVGTECKGIGHWKAEGLQKFSFPMTTCIFENRIEDDEQFQIQTIVSRLTELHFYSGRLGWTDEMIDIHFKMAWRLNILVEEIQGLHMCTISLHNLTHIHEDIINFAACDNYWCAVFERAVKHYVKKSNNCKGIERTFASSEARREFLKSLGSTAVTSELGKHDILQGVVSSVETGRKIATKDSAPRQVFLVGSASNIKPLQRADQLKVAEAVAVPLALVSSTALFSNRCLLNKVGYDGTMCCSGDVFLISNNGQETVVKIETLLSVNCGNNFCNIFGNGYMYQFHYDVNGQISCNYWTGFHKVNKNPADEVIFFAVENILRKVMLYDCGNDLLTVVDYMRPWNDFPYVPIVPVFPEKGDMLLIQGEGPTDVWYGHAQDVDHLHKTVEVYFFIESNRCPNVFVRESRGRGARNTVLWRSVIGLASGDWSGPSTWTKDS